MAVPNWFYRFSAVRAFEFDRVVSPFDPLLDVSLAVVTSAKLNPDSHHPNSDGLLTINVATRASELNH
jgi:hypothetical protein